MKLRNKIGAIVVALAASVALLQTQAQAATGGGCQTGAGGNLRACISFDGYAHLYPDFYVLNNVGCWKVDMLVYFGSGVVRDEGTYTVSYGHYGPKEVNVATLPQSTQSAYTRLNYFDCNWNYLGYVTSPTIYYYA